VCWAWLLGEWHCCFLRPRGWLCLRPLKMLRTSGGETLWCWGWGGHGSPTLWIESQCHPAISLL
jgi:hypothetical protein